MYLGNRRHIPFFAPPAVVVSGNFTDRLNGETADLVVSPQAIVKSWADAGNPTVQVERGWGTGTLQDLYPHTDGKLYTEANGGGQEASVWAGGSLLLVEKPYNQAAANTSTNQPSKISDDRRVLLNLDTTNAPFFAGYLTGTQDANQHATERGYETASTLQTNADPFSTIAIHAGVSTENVHIIQDDSTGSTRYWRLDGGSNRNFGNWAIVVGTYEGADDVPNIAMYYAVDDARGIATDYRTISGFNGNYEESNVFNSTSTSYDLRIFGPTNSLRGKCYGVIILKSSLTPQSMFFDGIPSLLAPVITNDIETDKPVISYPYANATVPMNLSTETADIPVRLIGKPSTTYEAQWQSGGYSSVGTTDANGVLDGALTGQSKGNGTLDIRESGGSTPVSISNVAVGVVMYVMGESGADGRGANVTHTIPTGSLRKDRVNWTAASNEWWKLLCQNLYDEYTAVISVTKLSQGSTYFLNGSTEGHWSEDNTSVSPDLASKGKAFAIGMQGDHLTPNFWLWDLGKNDASLGTSEAAYETRFTSLLTAMRTATNNSNHKFWPIVMGENGAVSAANTDAIRRATMDLWDTAGFEAAGSFAHLDADLDGTHFDTQAQKQKAADVVGRHFYGSGRAPQFSSASIDGADVDIVLTGGVSPMTISAGTDVAGWSVTDDNGARTVNSVSVSTMTVTLTCDQSLVSPVDVSWSSNNSAVGTTLDDSDSTTPLPPEPFETTISS